MSQSTSIVFTGDIGFDRYMDRKWEDENLLSQAVLDFFHSADHVVANVEGAVVNPESFASEREFIHYMPVEASSFLKKINADIWCIGNNHILDAGMEGLLSTRRLAEEMGYQTIGAGRNKEEASEPVYTNQAGGIGMI
ncbi:MAG: CapA family protein, partial [Firmicutes bacterium]|nr:CapA family protein [Bacillota bacterium]